MTAVTYPRVIASEFTKLHSLRSSRVSLLMALGLVVGLGLFVPWLSVSDWRDGTPTIGYNAVERSLSGIYLAQIAFGVLGAMVVTGEYATGSIRSTFAAVPRRLPVLWSKLAVFLVVTLVLGTLASVLAFTAGQAIFSAKHVDASLGDPGVTRAVLGCGLFLAGMGAFGLALGALLRNTAAAVTTFVAVFFVIPPMTNLLPASWTDHFAQYLPSNAGSVLIDGAFGVAHPLSPLTGFAVMTSYAIALIGLAAWRLHHADA